MKADALTGTPGTKRRPAANARSVGVSRERDARRTIRTPLFRTARELQLALNDAGGKGCLVVPDGRMARRIQRARNAMCAAIFAIRWLAEGPGASRRPRTTRRTG